jgi:muconolactone delta-isomerase
MKYQVTINFYMDESFMNLVPAHRALIEELIESGQLEYYTVSIESMKSWMVFNAASKEIIQTLLKKSPLYDYWTIDIDELFVYDSKSFRLPELHLN